MFFLYIVGPLKSQRENRNPAYKLFGTARGAANQKTITRSSGKQLVSGGRAVGAENHAKLLSWGRV